MIGQNISPECTPGKQWDNFHGADFEGFFFAPSAAFLHDLSG
jgi:hypothetical protein